MTETRILVSEAIDGAVDFTRDAWREAWAPTAFTVIGWMLIVVGRHAAVTSDVADICGKAGWALLLFYLPLLGALYRFGVGGRAYGGKGPGGLQLGGAEWRIVAVNAVLVFTVLLALLPLAVLSGLLYLLLHRFGSVNLGPAGPWAWWFLISAAFAAALFGAIAYACARLSLAMPQSVERQGVLPFSGWPLTEGLGRTILAAFVLAHIPALAVWLALQAFGWIEPADVPVGLHGPWPVPAAVAAGLIAGAVLSAVQAPLGVGVITTFFDVLAPPEDSAIPLPLAEIAEPGLPVDAVEAESQPNLEPEPEPAPEPPFSVVEFFAHTGRFSRLMAPWLADEPVPESYAAYLGAPQAASTATEPEQAALEESAPQHEAQTLSGPEPGYADEELYPHSVVAYSPEHGRFTSVFAPWLVEAEPITRGEPGSSPEREPEVASVEHLLEQAHVAEPHAPESHAPEPHALDGAGEAEHAEP